MTMLSNENIGKTLRLNRIKRGMTRKRMCRQLWHHYNDLLKPAQLRRYEEGKANITAEFLNKAARIFNVEVSVLFKEPNANILIDKRTTRLIEAYLQITPIAAQDSILYLMRHMAKG